MKEKEFKIEDLIVENDFGKDDEPAHVIDTSCKSNHIRQSCPDGYDTYNEDWYLSTDGDMCNSRSDYFIEADRLDEDDWILHCMEMAWFDGNTFLPAYWEACRRAGIKEVTMKISYQ